MKRKVGAPVTPTQSAAARAPPRRQRSAPSSPAQRWLRRWASYATSCETIATQIKTTDWEDVLDMDAEDASELQAWAHTVAKMCEKVKRGWS